MELLIGLILAAAVLYFWLVGNWFARVVVFLGLELVLMLSLLAPLRPDEHISYLGLIFGSVVIWLISDLPARYWRYHNRRMLRAEAGAD